MMNEIQVNAKNIPEFLEESIEALVSPKLDPLFWTPQLLGTPSAWWAHLPFAFWIMSVCRPRIFVELGSHYGVSYAGFCETVLKTKLDSRCYAVDTWEGEQHAGYYSSEIYDGVRAFNNSHYSAFSELLKCTFDEALAKFSDNSIDLLHIDGLHTYEAVKHDFENWLPKLSKRGVVLLHDTNVLEADFGVHRFFAELAEQYPSFEFFHGHGLGVVIVGKDAPEEVKSLCSMKTPEYINAIRDRFSQLGAHWHIVAREKLGSDELQVLLAKEKQNQAALQKSLADMERDRADLEREREKVVQTYLELRQKRNHDASVLGYQISNILSTFFKRYSLAFDDPNTGLKARLKRRLLKAAGALGKKRLEVQQDADIIRKSYYFDRQWYLNQYPDVAATKIDPALHYLLSGAKEGRDPGPVFSSRKYLADNAAAIMSGENPLLHCIRTGAANSKNDFLKFCKVETPQRVLVKSNFKLKTQSIVYISGEPNTPGNLYRVIRYIDAARANGLTADWIAVDDLSHRMKELTNFDVLIIWRAVWSDSIAQAVSLMHSLGKKVIFDCDDLMTEPQLATVGTIDGIRSQNLTEDHVKGYYERIRKTMLEADLCFATTEELAFHYRVPAGKVTHILPNGFDQKTHDFSRYSMREWSKRRDDLLRIGYAGGSRTHQRDLNVAMGAIARVLREYPNSRFVLFRTADGKTPLVDIEEFPALAGLEGQIEWRPLQPLNQLPQEMARFDINIAPLEHGNVFCEAKSELKFFEAALVDVATIASPTGPYRRAIEHGKTGFLATSEEDWYHCLKSLLENAELRKEIGREAYKAALAKFGPRQRALKFGRVIDQLGGGALAARGFALDAHLSSKPTRRPEVYPSDVVYQNDKGGHAEVSVIIPLYNYEGFILEALDSIHRQTLKDIDLVIVDGCSTDNSLAVATKWAKKYAERFNRIVVLKNRHNYGLALCRNSGFDAAETAYVLPLDADNKLLPECCEKLLFAIKESSSAFVYPTLQKFGDSDSLISNTPYDPQRFVARNYIDALALVSKEAWAIVGGYRHTRFGWEDYDFWCRFAEFGLSGEWYEEILAEYRVHENSMMYTQTLVSDNYRNLFAAFEKRHPWVSLWDKQADFRYPIKSDAASRNKPEEYMRLDALLSLLRCPTTGQKLSYGAAPHTLVSLDGSEQWPIINGRPSFARELAQPEIKGESHISNELPAEALDIIRSTKGMVLNLSAGGSAVKYDNVVEVEYAIFRHTDIVADAHHLPFDNECFSSIIVMNAFEHYREPHKVAAELFRVLKPGGRIYIRTAFLQPLHEKPWHFYNCTRYGMAEWFKAFEAEKLHVSENFCPNHTVAWIASEAEAALRADVSPEAAESFMAAPISSLVEIWRDPSKRDSNLWRDFEKLSQDKQEVFAAGFEFLGRRPEDVPDLKKSDPK